MKFAITGAGGFLGWHVRCALKAAGHEATPIARDLMSNPIQLASAVRGVDVVLHLAGANRADPQELRDGNLGLARALSAALDKSGSGAGVVYANSIHSGDSTPFGDGKKAAADHLMEWGSGTNAPIADVRLPNLFGEHGRAYYNSVIATFCFELATGRTPAVDADRPLPLMHVQAAVRRLLDVAEAGESGIVGVQGRPTLISNVLDLLSSFSRTYAAGEIPDLTDPFHLELFNTYRSFCFPRNSPFVPPLHGDARGTLFECVKGHGGQTQVFCSTSHPGVTRGEHFHLSKVERFIVVGGRAEIALRRLFHDDVVRFVVSGDRPAIVDMPTMWAHSIRNVGQGELTTLFWANEIYDARKPDTFPEPVHRESAERALS